MPDVGGIYCRDGTGNNMNVQEELDFYRRQDFDDSPRRRKLNDTIWQLSPEDWAAEERHWAERERENGEGR